MCSLVCFQIAGSNTKASLPIFGPRCRRVAMLAPLAVLCVITSAAAQNTPVQGSVPSGPASNEVLQLTLSDSNKMALRYNLGGIESGENAQIARGQRLLALSRLLPQVSASASENVSQLDLATLGLKKMPVIPSVIGPYWNAEGEYGQSTGRLTVPTRSGS